MSSPTPLISVCCITYNHENFIQEALDGFLIQQTSFPIEIIVHDDASTDNTTNIIYDYKEKHPDLIKIILQTENQYSKRGFGFISDLFAQARGKYIALCEGDDYWTDPFKLQKQVDFLEANLDFAICFHKVNILEAGQIIDDYITWVPSSISTITDLANGNYIHTPSCVFKNNTLKILGANFHDSPLGDYYIHMMNAQYGKIFCIDEVMSIYRLHGTSTFSSQSMTYKIAKTLKAIEVISKDLQKPDIEVNQRLIDAHIRCNIDIYNQLQLTPEVNFRNVIITLTDFKNTLANFHPDEYRLRLIENLIDIEKKVTKLETHQENNHNSIRWLTKILVLLIKKRIFKLFT